MKYRTRIYTTITAIVAAFSMVVFLHTPVIAADNCPETYNPGQQDADGDGIGDACDEDTIYGYISGDFKEGIEVNIATVSCSGEDIIATLVTDEDGYYSIGDLENNAYKVSPEDYDYIFFPNFDYVQISTAL